MKKERQNYSKEFKLETIGLSKTSGKSDSQLERELGLSRGRIYNWRKQVEQDQEQAFPGKGHLKKDDEYVRQLERELAITRQERDILKKAVAIFAPNPRS
jgi:transposase